MSVVQPAGDRSPVPSFAEEMRELTRNRMHLTAWRDAPPPVAKDRTVETAGPRAAVPSRVGSHRRH